MRKIAAVSLCVIVLALVYTFAQAQPSQTFIAPQRPLIAAQQPQLVSVVPAQTTWEYTALAFSDGNIQQFTNLGNQGWELVSVAPNQTTAMQVTSYVAYFKRPRLR